MRKDKEPIRKVEVKNWGVHFDHSQEPFIIEQAYNLRQPFFQTIYPDRKPIGDPEVEKPRVLDVDKTVNNFIASPKPEEAEFYQANNKSPDQIKAYLTERWVRTAIERSMSFRTDSLNRQQIRALRKDIEEKKKLATEVQSSQEHPQRTKSQRRK